MSKGFEAGAEIMVIKEFKSDDDSETPLKKGYKGTIEKVEDDGDLCVVFIDVSYPHQVFVSDDNFDKLKLVKPAPGAAKTAAKASPKVAAKASPKVAAKASPKGAAKASPKDAKGKASPKVAAKTAPKVVAKSPAKVAAKAVSADPALNAKVASVAVGAPRVASQLLWECIRNNSSFIRKAPNMPVMSAERGNLLGLNSYKFSGLANKKVLDVHRVVNGKKEAISVTTTSKRASRASHPQKMLLETGLSKEAKKGVASLSDLLDTRCYRRDLLSLAKKKYNKVRTSFKKKAVVVKSRRAGK